MNNKILSVITLFFLSLNISSVSATDFFQKSTRQNATAVANNDPVTALKWNGVVLDISNLIDDIGWLKAYIDANITNFFVETPTRLEQITHDVKIGKNLNVLWEITASDINIPEWGIKNWTIVSNNIKDGSIMLNDLSPWISFWTDDAFLRDENNNVYYSEWNVWIWTIEPNEKLEVKDGTIKFNTPWTWIIYPDGTKQETANQSVDGVLQIEWEQVVEWIKQFEWNITIWNNVVVNNVTDTIEYETFTPDTLVSEKALKDYIALLNSKEAGVCWSTNWQLLDNADVNITEDISDIEYSNVDMLNMDMRDSYRTPQRTSTQIILTNEQNDERLSLLSPQPEFQITEPTKFFHTRFKASVDNNDCWSSGAGIFLEEDTNNQIYTYVTNSRNSWRSYDCGGNCNNKNFAGKTSNWSCISTTACWPWTNINIHIRKNGVFWAYIYNTWFNTRNLYEFDTYVDFANRQAIIKIYDNNWNILKDDTVNLPNPTNSIDLDNVTGNYKVRYYAWRTCSSYSPHILEPKFVKAQTLKTTIEYTPIAPNENMCNAWTYLDRQETVDSGWKVDWWTWTCQWIAGWRTATCKADFSPPIKTIKLRDEWYRTWSNNTLASSCNEYLRASWNLFKYEGDTWSGFYRINTNNWEKTVYCDMETDGGWWTRYFECDTAETCTAERWNEGVDLAIELWIKKQLINTWDTRDYKSENNQWNLPYHSNILTLMDTYSGANYEKFRHTWYNTTYNTRKNFNGWAVWTSIVKWRDNKTNVIFNNGWIWRMWWTYRWSSWIYTGDFWWPHSSTHSHIYLLNHISTNTSHQWYWMYYNNWWTWLPWWLELYARE